MVVGQRAQRLAQRTGGGRHLGQLLRRQVVQVAVQRLAGIGLGHNAVDGGHQERRERQVRIGRRIGTAELGALRLRRVRVHRDAHRGAAVAARVGQVDRRLEPGNQPLVAVGRRVGERQQRRRVAEDAADGVQRHLRQARVAVAGEQVLVALPDRQVRVHAGAVVVEQRLRHEGGGLVVAPRGVLDHVLVLHHPVGHLHHRGEAHVDLALSGSRHFVMLSFDGDADVLHDQHHLAAQVLQRIGGRHREVPFLVTGLVAQVGLLVPAGVPAPLLGVDVVEARVLVLVEADVVEHEELRLRPEEGRVAQARGRQVGHRLARDVARVARIVLTRDRIADVADEYQRLASHERIDEAGRRIRHDQHVGLVDGLPAANARSIEPQATLEVVDVQRARRNRKVLPDAREVDEPQVDDLRVFVLNQLQCV